MKLTDIDTNFCRQEVSGVTYKMVDPHDLTLEGFPWEAENKEPFYRIPESYRPKASEGVAYLSKFTAGGVCRFVTDSPSILLKGKYRSGYIMRHMAFSGQTGFDITLREEGYDRLIDFVNPEVEDFVKEKYDFSFSTPLREGMHEYRIIFPLYGGVDELEIGFEEGATVEEAPPHKIEKPILFYGSSITQGGCASRPSTCHCAMVASAIDAPQINMGFSGSAIGEPEMAEIIASLDLSCFVMDYDHNAPTVEHLAKTHEPFFKIIREKHPNLPIVFVSRPLGRVTMYDDAVLRKEVILRTYENAKKAGDKHVYFVDGMTFFKDQNWELPTADGVHPTDLGFYLMAQKILPVVKESLGL